VVFIQRLSSPPHDKSEALRLRFPLPCRPASTGSPGIPKSPCQIARALSNTSVPRRMRFPIRARGGDRDASAIEHAHGVDEAAAFLPSRFSSGQSNLRKSTRTCRWRADQVYFFLPGAESFAPFSTMKAESPCVCAARSVTAARQHVRIVAIVINVLVPFSTHPPLARAAVMRALPHPTSRRLGQSPGADKLAGRQLRHILLFLRLVPARNTWFEHSDVCAATMIPTEPSTRESSQWPRHTPRSPCPRLYSGGKIMPINPSLPSP